MATIEECRAALERLADSLAEAGGEAAAAAALHRSLSCRITDLPVVFTGHLADGRLRNVTASSERLTEKAQIHLALAGDDLLALVDGELHFAKAWASGRVKVEAGFRDLLRLRSLL
ncbi:SCP2 sterol-binding domain-containing protein [Streptomyces sp. NPDC059506]|uniref:SCP2 domain-containing protein n=1 Tax=Streptomyces thermolineatus TaxID=44033 RepID=A0ABN3MCE4_9ACTN|nr:MULTISPECIES: SCP2 sterol-binding domain-containing protein [unclassified Streptomyces]MCZ2528009.1 SCP2 sterol-binding domain-containing protein [Streptomyces sp. HB2AG]PLW73729.1 sterol-binding protein [Streptomyces sp. DJ]QMV24041.1 sterol-binding protein [Streptomyces sp. SCUT-3]